MNISKPGDKMMFENIELDRSILERMISEVGEENITSLIGLFIEELDKHLDQIERAAKEPNFAVLARSGHTLKSSAASFGATGVSRLASEMEEKATQKNTAGVRAVAIRLSKKAESARECLLFSIESASLPSTSDRSC
jgi:HPt (histidine-containing phosphotransfer) domain-containing protein